MRCDAEHPVESIEKPTKRTATLFSGPEQECRKRRTERQCVECGEDDGDRDGQGELLIQTPCDSGKKCCRNEHCGKNKCDANDRRGNLTHGLKSRLPRIHSFLNVTFDRFNDDNRVIDHQSDRQNQTKQREGVN